jgi:uncharacterized OB-fold protein
MLSKIECPRCGAASANFVHGVCRACYMRDYHQRRSAAAVTQCPRCGVASANFVHGVCRACYMRGYHQRRSAGALNGKQRVFETSGLIDDSEGERFCIQCKAPGIYARGRCLNCDMRDGQRQRQLLCGQCGESAVYARGRCENCYKRHRQHRLRQRRCVECGELGIYARSLCQNCYMRDRRRHQRMKLRTCTVCAVSFQSVRRDALYCSTGCRQKAHRVGKAQPFGVAATHAGERGTIQSVIETEASLAARIGVQAHAVALDPRLGQIDSTIEEAAKSGRINAVFPAIYGQRKASTLADLIKAERETLGAKGRQIEAEAAPIRHAAEPIGAEIDSEWALRWLLALIMLCCDTPASGHTVVASARHRTQSDAALPKIRDDVLQVAD